MRKIYGKCFAFCGVFCENIREIPTKCEIQKLNYSRCQYAMQKPILFPSIAAQSDMKILSWKKGIRQHNNSGQE